jgi:3-oxoacyl-[acyl-carrier protein] reductase
MARFLIIGATSTIAYCVAEKLIHNGHDIYLIGRNLAKTEGIAKELNCRFAIAEASNFESLDKAVAQAVTEMEGLEGIVNCAGSLLLKSAHSTSQDEYEKTISANLTTAFAVVRAAGKYMVKQGGSIVLVSSAAALTGIANHEAIAAAKAGILGLTLSAAASYSNRNLRFNAIAPGLVETNLTIDISKNDLARNASLAMHALGRLGKPEDIASAIIFFLLPENSWVTGQVLGIDGGLSCVRPKMKL